MKKIISIMLALTILLVLTACGHRHSGGDWEVNDMEHWKFCTCGEKYDAGSHELDDMSMCAGCGAEVLDWGDSVEVTCFNEQYIPIRYLSYDDSGNLIRDIRVEYGYNAEGDLISEMHYENEVLVDEYLYEKGDMSTHINHGEDGTRCISQYDEGGNIVSVVNYDAEDQVIYETHSEYALDDDGNRYEVRNIIIEEDGTKYVFEYNEHGNQIVSITYDPDGNSERHENAYTADNQNLIQKIYKNEVLVQEQTSTLVTNENGGQYKTSMIIDYHADGSKTVTEYNIEFGGVTVTSYDAEGNVIG